MGLPSFWPDRFNDSRKTPMVGRKEKEIRFDQIRRQVPIDWIPRSYANLASRAGAVLRWLPAGCVSRWA